MNRAYNYVTVATPHKVEKSVSLPFAQFIDSTSDFTKHVDADLAAVQIQDLHLPNFSVRVSKGVFTRDAMLVNTSGQDHHHLGSCLFPKIRLRTFLRNKPVGSEILSGTQNFKFDPQNEFQHKLAAHVPFHMIHFSYSASYLSQFLSDQESWSAGLKAKIFKGERVIGEKAAQIQLAQEHALQNIFDCPLSGKLGEWMMESSMVQIILIQLHALFHVEESVKAGKISKHDQDMMQSVKEYLQETFLQDHTLEGLTRHFGVNASKLMMLFKKIFGKSIFEHLTDLKMQHALVLLKDEKRVTEVSRVIGYKNPNHFSTAFTKRFGMNPSQVR